MHKHTLNQRIQRYHIILLTVLLASSSMASVVLREQLEPGVYAAIRGGQVLFLECSPPKGNRAQSLLGKYLADGKEWRLYKDRLAVAIPFKKLNVKSQRKVLEVVFPLDYVDAAGWWHTVRFSGTNGAESVFALAEWLTGSGADSRKILDHNANQQVKEPLNRSCRILIPQPLLQPVMKTHSPQPPPPPPTRTPGPALVTANHVPKREDAPAASAASNSNKETTNGLLKYGENSEGPFAQYELKLGESLYSAVVVRFTDYRENEDILHACEIIQKRSGIHNVHRMNAGQRVIIPVKMLSDRYQPAGSESRQAYEEIREEARRLRADQIVTKDLDGVVVVLDSGHGGRDRGAAITRLALFEDEINYDIVCRIKLLLETYTRAKVHTTVYDRKQGNTPTNVSRFTQDSNEVLKTTPNYTNTNAKISANLRWYLANDIYFKERGRGVNERKIIFASIHCDALFNDSLRGAMVYVPGAKYRRSSERPSGSIYKRFEEVRRHPTSSSSSSQRRKDEALSQNFANTLLQAMRSNNPPLKVHDAGDPIRNVIRQSRGRAYVPAVLRNTIIPTKVLVEVANMTNPKDQKRLADPEWRQWFAEAFVTALRKHFNN
ncbi:MAG: N-acetylmuramoyl-L-alanine amidase [Candidatus Hydrogenedentes bacterium]|nr:N-acetylmuramoyl-L-alanine amidase [Candidatus Hydrogenedentota bacterium]